MGGRTHSLLRRWLVAQILVLACCDVTSAIHRGNMHPFSRLFIHALPNLPCVFCHLVKIGFRCSVSYCYRVHVDTLSSCGGVVQILMFHVKHS